MKKASKSESPLIGEAESAIAEAILRSCSGMGFEKWRQKHPKTYQWIIAAMRHHEQYLKSKALIGERSAEEIDKAARQFASEILAVPPKEIYPDDSIIAGFKAGVEWGKAKEDSLPEATGDTDDKTTVLKDLEQRVAEHGYVYAIESAADDIVALRFELEQLESKEDKAFGEQEQLIFELTKLATRLTKNPVIMSVLGSINDTMTNEQAVEMLKEINRGIDPLTAMPFK